MAATYIPEPYKCVTASEIEDAMAAAILDRIEQRGLTAAEISRRYPSIRSGHIAKLQRGDMLGFRMLSALTEAVGLRVNIEVTP
ncbi:hypothetical protein [Gellertiella hungarica]|uniref:HTH cro/C1-type domain-containing protein n=1 Tax=Gellertiella hungarica TaxID=1572859 RepID=A0A7W6J3F3_9HYPH|nr:hypothetical protein [Gellertiella hungarica]MBB4064061.1 hypothetical protein [Gellertiella hungarica]